MMRKDLVFGMSIGGVLLAIGVIYFTFSSHKPKPIVTLDGGNGAADVSTADAGGEPMPAGDRLTDGGQQIIGGHVPAELRAEAGGSVDAAPSIPGGLQGDRTDSKWYDKLYGSGGTPLMSATPGSGSQQAARPDVVAIRSEIIPPPGEISAGPLGSGPVHVTNPGSASRTPSSSIAGTGSKMRQHRVQAGETFSSIAAAAYGSSSFYPHILRANPGIDPRKMRTGLVINLPDDAQVKPAESASEPLVYANSVQPSNPATPGNPRGPVAPPLVAGKEYRVQGGDNLHRIASKLYGTINMVQPLYDANKDKIGSDPAKLKLGMVLKLPSAPPKG